jgi:hypothetical protein
MASVFWDKHGILIADYLQEGATSTEQFYIALLYTLKQQ